MAGSHFPKASIVSIVPQYNFSKFIFDNYIFGPFFMNSLMDFYKESKFDFSKNLDLKQYIDTCQKNKQRLFCFDGSKDIFSNTLKHSRQQNYYFTHNEAIRDLKEEYISTVRKLLNDDVITFNIKQVDYIYYEEKCTKRYININFENTTDKQEYIKIFVDNKLEYTYIMPANRQGKFYNIIIPTNNSNITVEAINDTNVSITCNTSNERIYTDVEINDCKMDIVDNGLNYKYIGVKKAKKLLVIFSGFQDASENHQYIAYDLNSVKGEDIAKISFRDNYFDRGTYMLADDNGESLIKRVIDKIKEYLYLLNIEDNKLIVFGASKGATVASMLIEKFKEASFIISAPQLDFEIFKNSRFDFNNATCKYLEHCGLEISELIFYKNILKMNSKSLLVEAIDDTTSRMLLTNNYSLRCNVLQLECLHHVATRRALPYWSNYIENTDHQEYNGHIHRFGNTLQEVEFIVPEIIGVVEYGKVISYIELVDIETKEINYTTVVGRKTSDGTNINVFCVKDIAAHIHDFSHFKFKKALYKLQLRIFIENKVYIISVKHENMDILVNPKNSKIFLSGNSY